MGNSGDKMENIIIIGAGPAGMSAAVYAKRAEFSVLVIERDFASGGQIVKTYEVDNYLGLRESADMSWVKNSGNT